MPSQAQSEWSLAPSEKTQLKTKFTDLCKQPVDEQLELFLKSFIFALGNNWKEVVRLAGEFKKSCQDAGENRPDMNVVQAANFLQKYGATRTATQRSAEVKDVDYDSDNRISFIEYMLLQYKSMVLLEFYKRIDKDPIEDLSDGAVGVTGVGDKLISQLFAGAQGISPELQQALEEFTAMRKAKESKLEDLQAKVNAGGVKGKAAFNELEQLKQEDQTPMNRIEITLNAQKKKAAKHSGDLALKSKKQEEEEEKKKKAAESKARLAEKAKLWEQNH